MHFTKLLNWNNHQVNRVCKYMHWLTGRHLLANLEIRRLQPVVPHIAFSAAFAESKGIRLLVLLGNTTNAWLQLSLGSNSSMMAISQSVNYSMINIKINIMINIIINIMINIMINIITNITINNMINKKCYKQLWGIARIYIINSWG